MARPDGTAGFTLLELLVALVVLGFVVAGIGQGARFGLRAIDRQEALTVEHGDLDAVDRLLRRLVVQMMPGSMREPSAVLGDPSAVAFATDLGAAASALRTSQAEVRLAVTAGRLSLTWRPLLHAARFGPPPAAETLTLLEQVDGIALSYWGAVGDQPPTWQSTWRQRALPRLVRIRLIFPADSGRHWPDIIAGPARPRPTG